MRNYKRILTLGVAGLLLSGASFSVSSGERTERLRVLGEASIELRSTSIPLLMCTEEQEVECPESLPYWALVIHTPNEGSLELNELHALGRQEKPEYIEIDGVPIRPGSRLYLDVTVERVTRGFAIIHEIHHWDFQMDLMSGEDASLESDGREEAVWTCRSVEREDPFHEVQVLKRSGLPRVADYAIQLSTVSAGLPTRPVTSPATGDRTVIARVANVDVEVTPDEAIFYGANSQEEIRLDLDLTRQSVRDVPGRFQYQRDQSGKLHYDMLCEMTTFLQRPVQ